MSLTEGVYARLPVWAQHAAVTTYGAYWHWLRFGPGYRDDLRLFHDRLQWSSEAWEAWCLDRLREVLAIASKHVPYYAGTWSDAQKQAACAGRLEELPLLEKGPLRRDAAAFARTDRSPRRRLTFSTSGSTGTPIDSLWTPRELRRSMALREARSAGWAGTSFSRPRATFSGRIVEPDPESRGPFYRFNAVERQVYLSAFHLRAETAGRYVQALRRHRCEWLTGYAVSFYLLARFIVAQGLEPPALRAVVTTSEKLTPAMREVMQEAYGCRVYEEYSTVENVLFASECEAGRLHVSPDAGRVEILQEDGSPCAPGEVGEVVATCLLRDYQPLIRFRLGDLAAWAAEPCPCGVAMPVLEEVVGRVEDVVVGPDGRQMVRFHGVFVGLPEIQEGQVVQHDLRAIRLRVVPAAPLSEAIRAELAHRVRQRLGPAVEVIVEEVEGAIPRGAGGKFRAVVSELGTPDGSA